MMTSFPATSSQPLSTAEVPRGIPSVEGRDADHLSTAVGLMPWIVAYGGQDSLEYAKAAAGMGPERNTASHHLSQSLRIRNQTALDTHGIPDTSNPNPLMFGVPLPPSFQQARHYAESERGNGGHPFEGLGNTHSPSADEQAQTLVALRELAKWSRLRNALLPNSEPMVGGFEVDPAGLADQLGVKGLSVYSAFIDIDGLRCRICGQNSHTIDTAMLHQRHMRHYQQ